MGGCDHNQNCCHQQGCNESSRHSNCCGSKHCSSGHDDALSHFLEIADCAWKEVLKEKIKEHILATQNERMTELAKIIAETNMQRWKRKMEKRKSICEFKEKLDSCFCQKCNK